MFLRRKYINRRKEEKLAPVFLQSLRWFSAWSAINSREKMAITMTISIDCGEGHKEAATGKILFTDLRCALCSLCLCFLLHYCYFLFFFSSASLSSSGFGFSSTVPLYFFSFSSNSYLNFFHLPFFPPLLCTRWLSTSSFLIFILLIFFLFAPFLHFFLFFLVSLLGLLYLPPAPRPLLLRFLLLGHFVSLFHLSVYFHSF